MSDKKSLTDILQDDAGEQRRLTKEVRVESLKSITSLANRALDLSHDIVAIELALKTKQAEHRTLVESTLPQLMDDLGMKDFSLTDGTKLERRDVVRASIPKTTKPAAHAWLRDNDMGDLIKTRVIVDFGKGEEDVSEKLREELQQRLDTGKLKAGAVSRDDNVHPSTLTSAIRSRIADGKPVPPAIISVYHGAVVHITPPSGVAPSLKTETDE